MKILYLNSKLFGEKSPKFNPDIVDWKNVVNEKQFGTRKMSMEAYSYYRLKELGYDISWIEVKKENYDKIDEQLQKADRVIISHIPDISSFVCEKKSMWTILHILKHIDKVRCSFGDPINYWEMKNLSRPGIRDQKCINKYIMDLHKDVSKEDLIRYCTIYKEVFDKCKMLGCMFYKYSREELDSNYKNGRFYEATFWETYLEHKIDPIPFKDKKNQACYCCASVSRRIRPKFKSVFGNIPITRIGATSGRDLMYGKGLSQAQVMDEYNKYRYIVAEPCTNPSMAWLRPRYLFAAVAGCIILTYGNDAQAFGTPYQLDKSIFDLPIEEQQKIAKAQKDYFFSRLMTQEYSDEMIKEWIK